MNFHVQLFVLLTRICWDRWHPAGFSCFRPRNYWRGRDRWRNGNRGRKREREEGKHWKRIEDPEENIERRGGKEKKIRGTAVSDITFTLVWREQVFLCRLRSCNVQKARVQKLNFPMNSLNRSDRVRNLVKLFLWTQLTLWSTIENLSMILNKKRR
jgi:hypothetical protein